MKVEIWSDIVCPFCYIGKRKFEQALQQFGDKEDIDIVWRSFQLMPDIQPKPGQNTYAMLAETKGISQQQAKQMSDHVTTVAAEVGLTYHLDKAVVANTLNAHRLTHLAAKHGLQDKAEERLFTAYFTEAKDINDHEVLAQLGTEIGLDADEVRQMLQSDAYAEEVKHDQYQARQVGVRGVPFFVFNDRYAVSGAQPSDVFLGALQQSWSEWKREKPTVLASADAAADGAFCGPDGNC
ncbi:DsbA family oxidoreductase [Nibrella saemangeumensis]|uniref:DsbA family oxidoreductase n=1 Tax=Nibrella saemangeumensis TaxID=1084526 RepID=A0ABP8NHZ6_9BACT